MVSRSQENAIAAADWAIASKQVVTPDGVREGAVLVRGEKIVAVVGRAQVPAGCPLEDVGNRVILPGLVDAHVHINEPGRTDWEGFATATRAAAAGGVTTLVDMPLNSSPVTTTTDALAQKLAAAEGKLWVDCGFYAGVIPGNAQHIEPLVAAGVLGFKAFLCPSGIDEFPAATESDLRAVMPRLASAGLPLLVHAELVGSEPAAQRGLAAEPHSYAAYLASRPRQWEHQAIELVLRVCREFGCRVHIVHLSSADALPLLDQARAAGLPVTVETCPHYLVFAAEEIPDGDPRFKCAPPIRERDNRDRLRAALRAGLIDYLASDHSPAPPALKHLDTGNLERAWGGIASLQLTLPMVWTMIRQWPGVGPADLIQWLSQRPAQFVGLGNRKGAVATGYDADLVVFDAGAEFTVSSQMLHHRHKVTPYEGRTLRGRVDRTVLRGRTVFDAGRFADEPTGRPLLRPAASVWIMIDLACINAMSKEDAGAALLKCCGARRWAEQMAAHRPYADEAQLLDTARATWRALPPADWRQAFAAHPQIGEQTSRSSKTAAWSAAEQSGVANAAEATRTALAEGNRRYQEKFGWIFIVCATGKSADEMLLLLSRRLANEPAEELRIAAAEQEMITLLRLHKLTDRRGEPGGS